MTAASPLLLHGGMGKGRGERTALLVKSSLLLLSTALSFTTGESRVKVADDQGLRAVTVTVIASYLPLKP
jgi:hypothetical protein